MPPNKVDVARETALQKIKQAEEGTFLYVLELAKAELGDDVAPFLDTSYGGYRWSDSLEKPTGIWHFDVNFVDLVVRIPKCAEILLRFQKVRKNSYNSLEWQLLGWQAEGRGGSEGKFAAVRFKLETAGNDEARVVPMDEEDWYITNNITNARSAAAEFGIEKVKLEAEAKEFVQSAVDRFRQGRR